jgi:hypothetical protein
MEAFTQKNLIYRISFNYLPTAVVLSLGDCLKATYPLVLFTFAVCLQAKVFNSSQFLKGDLRPIYAHINDLPGGYTPGTTGGKRGGIWYFIHVFCP